MAIFKWILQGDAVKVADRGEYFKSLRRKASKKFETIFFKLAI
jgi:hypothetical protein